MPVFQLSTQNFQIVGHQRQSLNINIAGNVLVFYKLQGCQGCGAFEPVFNQLSNEDRRVSYATLDLTYNREVIQLSRTSTTPITKVPHLILYVQGRPHARFKGDKDITSLKSFITGALQALPAQSSQPPSFVPAATGQPNYPPSQPNMYGGAQPAAQPAYMPEIGAAPAAAARIAQGGIAATAAHPSMQQQCDPDDEDCLMIPDQIIPHNMPWEGDKKMFGRS